MVVVFVTDDGSLAKPDKISETLHGYHDAIEKRIGDGELLGLTGDAPGIRRIVVCDETDVSDLEDWLGANLVVENER